MPTPLWNWWTNMTLSRDQIIANHEKLIKIMERLPPEKHVQSTWGMIKKDSHDQPDICGTTACALGWAAISKEIEGLDTELFFSTSSEDVVGAYMPTINGRLSHWRQAGEHFFGPYTHGTIFISPRGSRDEVVKKLKQRLEALKNDGQL